MLAILLVSLWGCSAEHYTEKAKVAVDAHKLARAESLYRKALARDSSHAPALAGLGWTYLLAGQVDAARGSFDRCRVVDPTSTECMRGRASVASADGNSKLAQSILEQAIGVDPHDAGVLSSLALQELVLGDLVAAEARYKQLIAREPGMAEYRLGLAEVRIRQDREVEAVEVVEAALALESVPIRYQAMLHQTQARALVAATADRVDPERCEETAAQVRVWLQAADRAVTLAESTKVQLPDLPVVRRLLLRRHAAVDAACPSVIEE